MDIPAIRTALKDTLSKINGLDVDNLRLNPDPPCAIVYPNPPFPFVETFDGNSNPIFTVLILVPYVDTDDAQDALDAYLSTTGPASVIACIGADQTLGGAVASAVVRDLQSYGPMQLMDGGTQYLSAEVSVEIWV